MMLNKLCCKLGPNREVIYVDPIEGSEWLMSVGIEGRRVALDELPDDIEVSTVFLGIKTNGGPFETLVFDKGIVRSCFRYETWAEAEKEHASIVAIIKAAQGVANAANDT